jgi:hypothetical protein
LFQHFDSLGLLINFGSHLLLQNLILAHDAPQSANLANEVYLLLLNVEGKFMSATVCPTISGPLIRGGSF